VAHALLILTVTLAAVAAAAAVVFSQTRLYSSEAVVVVEPPAVSASSGNPPNMATEEGVVSSTAVLARAASVLHVPVTVLASGLSAHSPGTTTLLQISYADSNARIAQQRAQTIAKAYVSFRSARPAAASHPAKPAPASTAPVATLVTPAPLPSAPSSPNYKIDMAAALIVGLALGLGAAALRDHMDDRLRGPLDLEARADVPVLALIPAFWPRRLPAFWPRRRDRAGRLVVMTNPYSVVAEAYRGLRARLVQAATFRNAKTLLVTSPGWEDRSVVAANLATALTQSFRGVVLVCADLRWGRAQELFDLGDGDGQETTVETLQATTVPGLQVLPPGAIRTDPLLEEPAWHTALSDIRRHADLIVIEAPPMLASADISPLTDLAEMILLVTDARRSTRAQLEAAMREVEHVRGKLIGCVLDNVGRRRFLRSHPTESVAGSRGTSDPRHAVSSGAPPASGPGSTEPDAEDPGAVSSSAGVE
jgi:polysaccharide biosynthesis transport protein